MFGAPILHHQALGIHRGAYVQDTPPLTDDLQDGVLWVDTSTAEPYALKCWDQGAGLWRLVGTAALEATLVGMCLTFSSHGARICNDAPDVLHLNTPHAQHAIDLTGYQFPAHSRINEETVPRLGDPSSAPILSSTVAPYNPWPNGTYSVVYTVEDPDGNETLPSPSSTITVDGTQWIHVQLPPSIPAVPDLPDLASWNAYITMTTVLTGTVTFRTNVSSGTSVDLIWATGSTIGSPPSSNTTTKTVLRVYDPTPHLGLEVPLPALDATPATLVGKDPATGLPAFCPQPVIPPDVVRLAPPVPVPTGGATTCVQLRCGAADALANKLADTYHTVEQWVQPALTGLLASFFSALAGAGFTLLDLLTDGLGLVLTEAEIALVATIDRAIGLLTAGVLGDALPFLNNDQQAWLKQAAFDSLICTNDTVQLDRAQMDGWYQRVLNASGDPPNFGFIQQEALYAIVGWGRDLALSDWAAAANTGAHSPSPACDTWS